MITNFKNCLSKLYQEDFVLWIDETVKQLQKHFTIIFFRELIFFIPRQEKER